MLSDLLAVMFLTLPSSLSLAYIFSKRLGHQPRRTWTACQEAPNEELQIKPRYLTPRDQKTLFF